MRLAIELERRREARASALLAPVAAVALLLLACSPRPVAKEPAASPTPFCFRATIRVGQSDQSALACWMTAATCAKAQQKAATMGQLAGLREVGQCREGR